ncbi:ABC transporter related protein OS=Tsukamurella paurometabola (strain ATCC 8368 / DSM / CCUG 35730 / CIP 100753 / JCM 10117 / KCTC 9821 / NBRC 16120 / NCIMB 702349 / NCTC 13040) OX=521096 GN=Tpau_3742 PE=4 SV=1 [Tsukamurella paurometabola]|uniref:ABC transporter related protein n=1 Tax=Tsukamurella paurometabola (strain ATCC 8368 / DSM 20162 / CCUG 35730 / CIP 100753 / JCM 10117 / KCTC 9821 / NBRC 16120 / NCIMB 702349 / NCTC 13040) TaxID=521096 RepID=D5UYL7_TSUPD|nr:ABC transporter ATP-binding protein [Tsukamurella paurometabola]ADG80320.1 ABC transporter related protein [Tsukamurella paurometabola DSM 20162]SUP39240.1 Daunorubicin/doxorubicin resistance ATP-binding protein DrrA [Tsukamurella paurometabola]
MIEVSGLTKTYGAVQAVNDLSFAVRPGRVTGFLGPNGAGKSTTMRCILGLDRPTAGTATIDGRDYAAIDRPLTQVGALLDAKWVHPNRTARNHLRWMAAASGLPASRADECLAMVGLSDVADKKAGGFSLGMSQRLGIAGALLGDPPVLMFDEPVNGLDPEGIVWVRTFMKSLAAQGRTVFVSSHLLAEMALTADDVVIVGRGHLVWNGTMADFIAQNSEHAVRVRSPREKELAEALTARGLNVAVAAEPAPGGGGRTVLTVQGATSDAVGEIAAAAGLPLSELAPQTSSLEQVFMQLTGGAVEYRGLGGAA